jgi:hypothetical protein
MLGPKPETECGEIHIMLSMGVITHAEVVVGLKRLGVRVIQQDHRGSRVAGPCRLWLGGDVEGG